MPTDISTTLFLFPHHLQLSSYNLLLGLGIVRTENQSENNKNPRSKNSSHHLAPPFSHHPNPSVIVIPAI